MKRDIFSRMLQIFVMAAAFSLIMGSAGFAAKQDTLDKVNINSATVKELTAVRGIGKKKAEAIIAYRTENGGFESVEDLKKVKGIGKRTFEKIKEHITVDGG